MGVPWTALTFDSVKGGRGVLRVEGGAQLQFPHLLTDVEALGQRILLFGHHHRVGIAVGLIRQVGGGALWVVAVVGVLVIIGTGVV